MLTFDGVLHFGEVFSSWMNPGFHCIGQMADSMYGEWFADVNVVIECQMVAVGLWYEQAYVMGNKHLLQRGKFRQRVV